MRCIYLAKYADIGFVFWCVRRDYAVPFYDCTGIMQNLFDFFFQADTRPVLRRLFFFLKVRYAVKNVPIGRILVYIFPSLYTFNISVPERPLVPYDTASKLCFSSDMARH